jgi:hypothetical protein
MFKSKIFSANKLFPAFMAQAQIRAGKTIVSVNFKQK